MVTGTLKDHVILSQDNLITVGAILLFIEQGIPSQIEAELEPILLEVGIETTIDFLTGLPEGDVLIHTIMILPHREARIMTVEITFQIEAEIMAKLEAEIVVA